MNQQLKVTIDGNSGFCFGVVYAEPGVSGINAVDANVDIEASAIGSDCCPKMPKSSIQSFQSYLIYLPCKVDEFQPFVLQIANLIENP